MVDHAPKLPKVPNLNIWKSVYTSLLNRATETTDIVTDIINFSKEDIQYDWRLNERHYGALQGLNKEETAKKHGEQQVKIWRRSYDIPPPPMDKSNPDHPAHYPIYKNIDKNLIPDAESLKDTFKRVIPYYEKNILPILKKEKNVIISAHGNSLRSLCKKIFNITDGSIVELEIPTGNPIHITLESDMSLSKYLYLDQKRAKKILINQ